MSFANSQLASPAISVGSTPRFLIVRRRYVGDIVLVTPLLRAIRQSYPDAQIDVVIDSPYRELLAEQPEVHRQLLLPYRLSLYQTLVQGWKFVRQLRRHRYDVVLDLSQNDRSQLVCRLAKGQHILTWGIEGRPLKQKRIYTEIIWFPKGADLELPIQHFHQSLLSRFGIQPDKQPAKIHSTPQELEWAKNWLSEQGITGKPIFIHPGTRSEARRWPVERFAEIARRLTEQGTTVILLGGPGDEKYTDQIRQAAHDSILVAPSGFNLRKVLALFRQGKALLAHDSGPMHLAIAAGLPVIALFGSQPVHVWAPDNAHALYLQSPQPCQNCLYPQQCVPSDSYRTYCVQKLDVEYVWSKMDTFLAPLPH